MREIHFACRRARGIIEVVLSVDDRLAIHELLALHGHLMDDGAFDRLGELFTADVIYDVSALGGGELRGHEALVKAARDLGDSNPLAHLVTNVVITGSTDAAATVRSKGLGLRTDGSAASVSYLDTVVRTDVGWRISRRVIVPRRTPLHG